MPISNFNGDTFVAFLDISGFKELLKEEKKAWQALDKFYQLGYDTLRTPTPVLPNDTPRVEGIFVSDCGILFVRGGSSVQEKLITLLNVVKKINEGMIEKGFMLISSIAYGPFEYQERIEFQGIEKNPVYGNAYLGAYLDSRENPPIQPGQCRIVIDKLPHEIINILNTSRDTEILKKILKESSKHYYFYWNVKDSEEIADFKRKYNDSYNLKYEGMLKALKGE